jgi:predicted nucleic acid-binding protein
VSVYYLDASAIVKRYADEDGSDWIRKLTDPLADHAILLAEITLAEVAAAFSAKARAPWRAFRHRADSYPESFSARLRGTLCTSCC